MPTRSSSDRPSSEWRSCRWRDERSCSCCGSRTLATAPTSYETISWKRPDLVDTGGCVEPPAGQLHGGLGRGDAILLGQVEDGQRRVVDARHPCVGPLSAVASGRPLF